MATRKSKGFDLGGSLSHLIRRTQQFAYDHFAQAVRASGLTPRQVVDLFSVGDAQ